jgi:hypothetical protein
VTIASAPQLRATRDPTGALSRVLTGELTAGWVAIILAGHGVYGLLLARSAALATLHALVTMALGLWFALTSTMRRVAMVCGYMAGSEVLWRLGKAALPWEFVKYAICFLVLVTMLRVRRLQWDWMAIAYFGLLIPSTLISFSEQDFEFARQQVSFNMSGPLALFLTTWFFAYLRPSRADLQRLFLAILAPVVSLGAIALTRAARLDELTFTDASNFQTSAGYGPNQVSTVLGFGVLLALLLAFLVERGARERALFGGLAIILGIQSALTFSRGGLFGAIGALTLAAPFALKGTRSRVALTLSAIALVAAADLVVLPKLDEFTGGALSARFQDTNPTGRDQLIRMELETFAQHPVFGTGPAALDEYEQSLANVHTEFTRLLSQHGTFGAFALATMLLLAWRDIERQHSSAAKAISLALVAWSLLTMSHAAMRLAITPFAFGMAAALYFAARTDDAGGTKPPPANGSADHPLHGAGAA